MESASRESARTKRCPSITDKKDAKSDNPVGTLIGNREPGGFAPELSEVTSNRGGSAIREVLCTLTARPNFNAGWRRC